jgi:hypothetical protein
MHSDDLLGKTTIEEIIAFLLAPVRGAKRVRRLEIASRSFIESS